MKESTKREMLLLLALAAVISALLTSVWARGAEPFEEAAIRSYTWYESRSSCPLAHDRIRSEQMELLTICSTFGLKAYVAARDVPDIAGELFKIYGEIPEFRENVDEYGSKALLVVQYFRERNSHEFRIRTHVSAWMDKLRGKAPQTPVFELNADQHGFISVKELRRRGHELLAEFEFTDGAKRKQIRRAIGTAVELFTGGITELEAAMVRGERVNWKQVAHASLDVAIVFGGAAAIVHSIRAARAAGRGAVLHKTGTALKTVGTVARTAALAGVTTAAIAVIVNPRLVTSAAGWLAEQIGLPAWVGVFLLAIVLMSAFLWATRLLYRFAVFPMVYPYVVARRFTKWYRRRHPKRA